MMTPHLTAAEVVRLLDLAPHPEGGYFRETYRDARLVEGGRAASTAIYYLLGSGDVSAWHRVDAAELWHFYAGAPLVLTLSADGHDASALHLGPDLARGQRPQVAVPAGWWQTATSLGAWTLVGCTVAPGFAFSGFELAPPGWRPVRHPASASDAAAGPVRGASQAPVEQVLASIDAAAAKRSPDETAALETLLGER